MTSKYHRVRISVTYFNIYTRPHIINWTTLLKDSSLFSLIQILLMMVARAGSTIIPYLLKFSANTRQCLHEGGKVRENFLYKRCFKSWSKQLFTPLYHFSKHVLEVFSSTIYFTGLWEIKGPYIHVQCHVNVRVYVLEVFSSTIYFTGLMNDNRVRANYTKYTCTCVHVLE